MHTTTPSPLVNEARRAARIVACYREVAYGYRGTTVAAWVEAAADELVLGEVRRHRFDAVLRSARRQAVGEGWDPALVDTFIEAVRGRL